MFELKPLHPEAIPAALEKANRYRLLNEPGAAESIYLDILAVDPDNQEALINIVLAMSDRFGKDYAIGDARITEYLTRIRGDYERTYYTGIMYERRGKALWQKAASERSSCFARRWTVLRPLRRCVPPAMTTRFCAGTAVHA